VRVSVKKSGSWKGAGVQRGLERGSRGLAIVRSRYQETTSEDTAVGKDLYYGVIIKCNYKLCDKVINKSKTPVESHSYTM
jgi:hypothetical protein